MWGNFHTRNRRRPRAKCAKPQKAASTLRFHAFTLCDSLPQAIPCLHVRPGEGTARSPFVTSRSLDTRGACPSGPNRSRALAAQRPQALPNCNTALFVVISHLSCIPLAAELRTMNMSQAPALAIFHTPARSNRFVWFCLPAGSGGLPGSVRSAVCGLGSSDLTIFCATLAVEQ